MKKLFTSESVTEGHSDKVCDRISDAILDECLFQDPNSKVACETVVSTGLVFITGEITSEAKIDYKKITKKVLKEIGYVDFSIGFDASSCAILTSINQQSTDINRGVFKTDLSLAKGDSIGAGDQGIMFGFACDETPELMPLPIILAHRLAQKLSEVRKKSVLDYLGPDGKTQVTIEYENNSPKRVDTVLISTQHTKEVSKDKLEADLIEFVIKPVLTSYRLKFDSRIKIIINPSGKFVIGGPNGDAGLTGRKIIVDTYGGYSCHGGGAFSGKDPSKVDRSATYMARYIAKNIVATGLAKICEIQLSYAIGIASPVSFYIDTKNTNSLPEKQIIEIVEKYFDARPYSIIKNFKLRQPFSEGSRSFYQLLSAYGHFGRTDLELPWEKIDVKLKKDINKLITKPKSLVF